MTKKSVLPKVNLASASMRWTGAGCACLAGLVEPTADRPFTGGSALRWGNQSGDNTVCCLNSAENIKPQNDGGRMSARPLLRKRALRKVRSDLNSQQTNAPHIDIARDKNYVTL